MLSGWRAFRALSRHDRRLLMEAVGLLACAWLGLRMFSFLTLRRLLGGSSADRLAGQRGLSIQQIRRVAWSVHAVARRLPVGRPCLIEALAADAMLRRRGCACELRLGVLPQGSGAPSLAAHAWLEHDGMVMLGQLENLSDYSVLTAPKGL